MSEGGITSELLREVLVELGAMRSAVEGLDKRIDETRADSREARDAALAASSTLREQNFAGQVERLKSEIHGDQQSLRADLVAANGRMQGLIVDESRERSRLLEAQGARISALEAERNKMVGMAGLAGWITRNLPWLIAGGTAFAAGILARGGVPGVTP